MPPMTQEEVEAEENFRHAMMHTLNASIIDMAKDGNCLFRAVAHQVYSNAELHDMVREKLVKFLQRNKERFLPLLGEELWDAYISRISTLGRWGDDYETQALSDLYQRPIHVHMYNEGMC